VRTIERAAPCQPYVAAHELVYHILDKGDFVERSGFSAYDFAHPVNQAKALATWSSHASAARKHNSCSVASRPQVRRFSNSGERVREGGRHHAHPRGVTGTTGVHRCWRRQRIMEQGA
jgi:hypothetical protein